ncbi:MAG: Fic family protein [Coriobacteriales bacterium]|nr:Fic family protein [Coriobacteriales bacterium]
MTGSSLTQDGFSSSYTSEGLRSTRESKLAYWGVALGLQAVDGLKPSPKLLELVDRNVKGELDYNEIPELLRAYYDKAPGAELTHRQAEADFASARINELYQKPGFDLSVEALKDYHRHIFQDTLPDAGEYKQTELWKKEPVLFGDTVDYLPPSAAQRMLQEALNTERETGWNDSAPASVVERIGSLTKKLWFVHPFSEGNTRTVATFVGKYLDSLGYNVGNDTFKAHSLYYRNALVRACYINLPKGIKPEQLYLTRFYENLLYNAQHVLRNRDLFVLELAPDEQKQRIEALKAESI